VEPGRRAVVVEVTGVQPVEQRVGTGDPSGMRIERGDDDLGVETPPAGVFGQG